MGCPLNRGAVRLAAQRTIFWFAGAVCGRLLTLAAALAQAERERPLRADDDSSKQISLPTYSPCEGGVLSVRATGAHEGHLRYTVGLRVP